MPPIKPTSLIYLALSTGVALVIILLSFFPFYESIELKLYDLRFRVRGATPARSDIGTVDIDVLALSQEGRFQDWTRDKHAEVIRFGAEHDLKMLAFDIYFPEPSTPHILARDLDRLSGEDWDREAVEDLVQDHDRDMAEAMKEAGNVYLAESFKPSDEEDQPVKTRTPTQEAALELLEPFYRDGSGSWAARLFSFYDIEPPIGEFIPAGKGVAYAQAVADGDGIIRRYPLVGVYDGRLFPSMALLMACDYLGVPFQEIEIIPGEAIVIPLPDQGAGPESNLRIPISKEGYMMVNWAGDWGQDFEHYPYTLLKDFRAAEQGNYILSRMKALLHENPDLKQNYGSFWQAVTRQQLGPVAVVQDVFGKFLMALNVAAALREDEGLDPDTFFARQGIPAARIQPGMREFFHEIGSNLALEKVLAADPSQDFNTVIDRLDLEETPRLKRNFAILKNLFRSDGNAEKQRPLYFYPSPAEFTHEGRTIAPFEFHDKILFYGLTATGTHDLNPMPLNPRYPMVGYHANALNTILDRRFIERVPKIAEVLLMAVLGILIGIIIPRFHPVTGVGITLSLWGIYLAGNYYGFTRLGLWLEAVGPSLIFLIGYVGITVYNYISQEQDKKFLHDTFKAYLSPELIDEMYVQKQTPQLGGEEGILTAYFTDIQSFSTITEALGEPTKLVELLNEYLTAMTDILLEHRGTLDKYEGDAIIAFFGAPMPLEDHAERACRAGLAMQTKLLELCQEWKAADNTWPEIVHEMFMRIGVNSGPIVTGNMGSATRMNYTMMGDAVNIAARLESICKQYGVFTVCSGETLALVDNNTIETRLIDQIRVVGKTEPVKMFELLGLKGELEASRQDLGNLFQEAQEFYLNREWGKARKLFEKARSLEPFEDHPRVSTSPSRVFLKRCQEFLQSPPGDDWDGVYTATSK